MKLLHNCCGDVLTPFAMIGKLHCKTSQLMLFTAGLLSFSLNFIDSATAGPIEIRRPGGHWVASSPLHSPAQIEAFKRKLTENKAPPSLSDTQKSGLLGNGITQGKGVGAILMPQKMEHLNFFSTFPQPEKDSLYEQRFNVSATGAQTLDAALVESLKRGIIEDIGKRRPDFAESLEIRMGEHIGAWRAIGKSADRIQLVADAIARQQIDMYSQINGQRFRIEDQDAETYAKTLVIRLLSLALELEQSAHFNSKEQFTTALTGSIALRAAGLPLVPGREEILDNADANLAAVAQLANHQFEESSKQLTIYLPPESIAGKFQEVDIPLAGAINAAANDVIDHRKGQVVWDWDTIMKSAGSTIRQFEWLVRGMLARAEQVLLRAHDEMAWG